MCIEELLGIPRTVIYVICLFQINVFLSIAADLKISTNLTKKKKKNTK